MKVLILGCCNIGSSIAKQLAYEGHEVTVISNDSSGLQQLASSVDVATLTGWPSYPDVLRSAGADYADVIVAVTEVDEVNMVASQVAYSLFDIPLKIARIRSPHYFIRNELFSNDNLPIDVFIDPEALIVQQLTQLIKLPGAFKVLNFAADKLTILGIKVTTNTKLMGLKLAEVMAESADLEFKIIAVVRGGVNLVLSDELYLQQGDKVFVSLASIIAEIFLTSLMLNNYEQFENIIIAGAGNIGSKLAAVMLDKGFHVKLIDNNLGACAAVASSLKSATVLEGSVTERDLLFQENISNTDIFCAVTNDDEDNVISTLQAKYLGASYGIALVNNYEYSEIFTHSSLDVLLSPALATVASVVAKTRKQAVKSMHIIADNSAEIVEVVLFEKLHSRVIGKTIEQLRLPKGVVFCALYRGGNVTTNFTGVLMPEDSMVFLLPDKACANKFYSIL